MLFPSPPFVDAGHQGGRGNPSLLGDYGVLSSRIWRLADLGAKHSMLLAGLGWGNMPSHLVQNDVAQGRLKAIRPTEFDSRVAQLVMCGGYLAEHRLGPAGQWMIEHLSAVVGR
jgi:DNA-binding transcriptional LysR family regulator